jgi:branched-chain amino acid transport system substrate-binding protein
LGFAEEVEALVNYLVDKKGIKDFALLYQDDALGFGTRSGAQKALAARGLKLKAEASLAVGEKSGVDSAFAAIKASGAKAVIMGVNFAPAAAFAQKANKEKSNLVIGGSNNMMLAEYLKAAGPSAEGTVIFSTFPPQETQLELINKFKADLKDAKIAETSNIEGYLNALVFVEGLKRAGKNLTRDSLINAFESMKDVDFGGIKVSFSTTSHSGIDKGYLIVVNGGKFEVLRD